MVGDSLIPSQSSKSADRLTAAAESKPELANGSLISISETGMPKRWAKFSTSQF